MKTLLTKKDANREMYTTSLELIAIFELFIIAYMAIFFVI